MDVAINVTRAPEKRLEVSKALKSFQEVQLGYSEQDVVAEANRCLLCRDAPCITACPTKVNIPAFIAALTGKNTDAAYEKVSENNPLASVCGRVCSSSSLCEKSCVLNGSGRPIAIRMLERFAGDMVDTLPKPQQKQKKSVAIIGSGAAGLSCAERLFQLGYKVTVFDALHEFGGAMRYAIPEFRLPNQVVDKKINALKEAGVRFQENMPIGRRAFISDIKEKHDAVFIATGAGIPEAFHIPGEHLGGVSYAADVLLRLNLYRSNEKGNKYNLFIGKQAVIVGGGFDAIDVARSIRRLGGAVTVMYEGDLNTIPCGEEMVHEAQEEGVQFILLTKPVKILGEEKVSGVTCAQMMIEGVDEDGRPVFTPMEGAEFETPCDQVIISSMFSQDPHTLRGTQITANRKGAIRINRSTYETNLPGVFAGGNVTQFVPQQKVVHAVNDGVKAANQIDTYLSDSSEEEVSSDE